MDVMVTQMGKGSFVNLNDELFVDVDVMILRYDEPLPPDQLNNIVEAAQKMYEKAEVPVLVLDHTGIVDFWSDEDLRKVGLKRIDNSN